MAQNSVYRLTYVQALNDVRFSNVIAFKQTSPNGSVDPRADLADNFIAVTATPLAALLSNQWGDRCIQIRDTAVAGQDFWRQVTGADGSVDVEPLPSEVCAMLKLFTDTPGVGNTGRLFFSGIPIDKEEDNCLTETYLASWATVIESLTSEQDEGGATFIPGLLKGNGNFLPFTHGEMKAALTVQRSRKQPIIC